MPLYTEDFSPLIPRRKGNDDSIAKICDIGNVTWTFGRVLVSTSNSVVVECKNKRFGTKHVAKIATKDSSMLFKEKHFYIRACKNKKIPDSLLDCVSFGSVEFSQTPLRFMIFKHHGVDLHEYTQPLTHQNLLTIISSMLNAFEYIHNVGYCHNDVKPANILVEPRGLFGKYLSVKLVDFGVCVNYKIRSKNGRYLHDKRLANAGTFNYCSLDCHAGYFSPVNDLHSFAITILDLLKKPLPWVTKKRDLEKYHIKKTFLEDASIIDYVFEEEDHVFADALYKLFTLTREDFFDYTELKMLFYC